MLFDPRPAELMKLIPPGKHVDDVRNLYCGHYDDCLDEAVAMCWTSWTCARCSLFTSTEHAQQELTRLSEAREAQPI